MTESLKTTPQKNYVNTQDNLRVLITGDTMSGDLDMGGQLVSTIYVGDEATSWTQTVGLTQDAVGLRVLKAGDTMSGDLRMSIGSDTVRSLGCDGLTVGRGFSLPLGNLQNQLQFAVVAPPQNQTPVTMQTTDGFLVQINNELCASWETPALTIK